MLQGIQMPTCLMYHDNERNSRTINRKYEMEHVLTIPISTNCTEYNRVPSRFGMLSCTNRNESMVSCQTYN